VSAAQILPMGRASSKVSPDEDLDDGASREPKWTRNSFSLSWKASEDFAKRMGGRLMTLREAQAFVKKKGPLFPKEDEWAAVMCDNGEHEWVQLGDKSHEQGATRGEVSEEVTTQAVLWLPDEDEAPAEMEEKRNEEAAEEAAPSETKVEQKEKIEKKVSVAEKPAKQPKNENLESQQRHSVVLWKEVKWQRLEESLPWSKAEQYATSQGGRLLSFDEARKFLRKHGAIYPGENHWVAVGRQKDRKRDFVQIGDMSHSVGKSHVRDFKQFPWWGDSDNGQIPWMNVVLWTQMKWEKAGPGLNLETSEAFAVNKEGELLTMEEARMLLETQGVLFAHEDQWAVVKTHGGRDWIQVGNRGHQTGKSYLEDFGSLPNWDT